MNSSKHPSSSWPARPVVATSQDRSIDLCVSTVGAYLVALDCRCVQQVVGHDGAPELPEFDAHALLAEGRSGSSAGRGLDAGPANGARRAVVVAGKEHRCVLRLGTQLDIWTTPLSTLARFPAFVAPNGYVGCFVGIAWRQTTYALLLEPALLT